MHSKPLIGLDFEHILTFSSYLQLYTKGFIYYISSYLQNTYSLLLLNNRITGFVIDNSQTLFVLKASTVQQLL